MFLLGISVSKGLNARRLYTSFGVNGLSKVHAKVKFTIEEAMKTNRGSRGIDRGSRGIVYSFLNLGARWGWSSTSRPGRLTPGTHCTEGWVDSRAGLDWCGKSHPHRVRFPDRPARRQSLYRLSYPAHTCIILKPY
jgi:hypothetical protein